MHWVSAVNIAINFATLMSTSVYAQGDGSYDIVAEGLTAGGQHYLNIYQATGAFVAGAPRPPSRHRSGRHPLQRGSVCLGRALAPVAYTDASTRSILALFQCRWIFWSVRTMPSSPVDQFRPCPCLGQGQIELMWRETVLGRRREQEGGDLRIANWDRRTVDAAPVRPRANGSPREPSPPDDDHDRFRQ